MHKATAIFFGILLAAFFVLAMGPVLGNHSAAANSCDRCRAAYNQCRIQRKGHPSCDRAYEACLKNCVQSGRRR